MTEKDTQAAFLRELAALIRKYELTFGACGCCDGISVMPLRRKLKRQNHEDDNRLVAHSSELGRLLTELGENQR